jgi:hypothetical protein
MHFVPDAEGSEAFSIVEEWKNQSPLTESYKNFV